MPYPSTDTDAGSEASVCPKAVELLARGFGAEFAIEDNDAILKKKALRIGYYTSRPSGHGRVWDWPDVQGITYGIGIAVGYDNVRFCLDLTQELRSLKNDAGYSDSALLTSLALTCTF